MNREQQLILQVLANHLAGKKTALQENLNWQTVLDLAHRHQVEGIVYLQCKDFIDPAFNFAFLKANLLAVSCYEKRKYLLQQLCDAFQKNNIEFFIVKGNVIAKFYPVPEQRTMGDTDIIIHTEDRLKADEIFLELGFQNTSHFENREWIYYKDNLEFELHDALMYREDSNTPVLEDYFGDFWRYVKNNELDNSYHFLYLLVHLRKHFLNSGVGFRQFFDLAVFMQNEKSLNWQWIEEQLKKLELLHFSKVCFAFINRWYQVCSPIGSEAISEDFYLSCTEKIFADGVFGFDNQENVKNVAVNKVRKANNKTTATAGAVLRNIFPNYADLVVVDHYAFLKGRPYLLPIAWLYRWLRTIALKRVHTSAKKLENSIVSEEQFNARNELLEKWGL